MKQENKILNLKYSAKPFGSLNEDDLKLTVYKLFFTINAITGWQMPEPEICDILIEQLMKKLEESFPKVNYNEVEYAFRNTSVKDYGKNFNLFIFDEVIEGYLKIRKEESLKEEQKKPVLSLPYQETLEEKLNDIKEYCDRDDINIKNIYLIPIYLYDDIIKLGLYNPSQEIKDKIYNDAKRFKLQEFEERAKNDISFNRYFQKYKQHFEKGYFEESEWNQIDSIFMKLSFLDYKKNVKNNDGAR